MLACSLTAAVAATPPGFPPQPKTRPAGLPADALWLSPCVATMGEHWGNPKTLPLGPFYGIWDGKPVFTEIMISVDDFAKGVSYANLHALPGYTIDHVDIEFEPKGHDGFPVPHYDVHAYYVSPATEARICTDGIPDPAMKPVNL